MTKYRAQKQTGSFFCFLILILFALPSMAIAADEPSTLLLPERVFDGKEMHTNWGVVVAGNKIVAVGPVGQLAPQDVTIDLAGQTLLPGLIEGHSHVLLHPYDETSWNDQVLLESWAERSARGVNHLEAHLKAGFLTLRDLGSEGAGYSDVGLRQALEKGVIRGPRLIVAGRAMVTTGSYGPKGFNEQATVPLGAEEADGDNVQRVARDQIANGADFVKVYADYRWGAKGQSAPTFTLSELKAIREVTAMGGRYMVAHANTKGGMWNAINAGVRSIEHGGEGDAKIFTAMTKNNVFWCPTLGATEAYSGYRGWRKGVDSDPADVTQKKQAFKLALEAGTPMCMGSDVGVFDHGDSTWEMELMVEYGMKAKNVLISATSGNAKMLGMENEIGSIRKGYIADIIAVQGNPEDNISLLRNPSFIMQGGKIIK